MARRAPETKIGTCNANQILVRDKDLVEDLIGKVGFTDMIYFHILNKMPTPTQTKVLDSVLVTLMEHGFTPSAIASRMIAMSDPTAVQSAVAAGILGIAGVFVGTMEGTDQNLCAIIDSDEGVDAAAARIAKEFRAAKKPIPGFGHPIHIPDDPRSPKLFEVALEAGVDGQYINALKTLSAKVDEEWGRHLTINATGAIGAVLCEIGLPWDIMRGIAVISRAAGLVGHFAEEKEHPSANYMWNAIEEQIPYTGNRKLGE